MLAFPQSSPFGAGATSHSTLKPKGRHLDNLLVTGYTRCCQNDNLGDMTTLGIASDKKLVNITAFLFQCTCWYRMYDSRAWSWLSSLVIPVSADVLAPNGVCNKLDTSSSKHNSDDGIPNHRGLDFCSIVCSGDDQRKYQSSAWLAFVRGIHRSPVASPHKGLVTQKMFPFDDVIMKFRVYPEPPAIV